MTQTRIRQSEDRNPACQVMQGVAPANHYAEFDRLEERVEREAAEEHSYLPFDDELNGEHVRRRFESAAVDDAGETDVEALRRELTGPNKASEATAP